MEKKEEEMKSKWGMGNIPLAVGIWFRHPKYKINSPDFFFIIRNAGISPTAFWLNCFLRESKLCSFSKLLSPESHLV